MIYFFENPPEFFIFLLYPWKYQTKQSSTPGEIFHKIVLDTLEIPNSKHFWLVGVIPVKVIKGKTASSKWL